MPKWKIWVRRARKTVFLFVCFFCFCGISSYAGFGMMIL